MFTIRQAQPSDEPKIAQLHAQSWRENYTQALSAEFIEHQLFENRRQVWRERFTKPALNQVVFVAEDSGNFCGFICLFGNNHSTHGTIIDNLHVANQAKGKGIGTQLIRVAAEWATKHYQAVGIYLEVLECNPKAIGFYESLGAKNLGRKYWHTPCRNDVSEFMYGWSCPEQLTCL